MITIGVIMLPSSVQLQQIKLEIAIEEEEEECFIRRSTISVTQTSIIIYPQADKLRRRTLVILGNKNGDENCYIHTLKR